MLNKPRIGVFICKCGSKISSLIDLKILEKISTEIEKSIDFFEILNFSCLKPGLDRIIKIIKKEKLNRIIIGGCEERLILGKFEKTLNSLGIFKGQIEILNLRGHIAHSNDLLPEQRAVKSSKLIFSAVEEMKVLEPTINQKIIINDTVMILGTGIALWSVTTELNKNKINFAVQEKVFDHDVIGETLKLKYPGYEESEEELNKKRSDILNSKYLTTIKNGELVSMSGITGKYELVFMNDDGSHSLYNVGTTIFCADCNLGHQNSDLNYNSKNIIIQNELKNTIKNKGLLNGQIVFWINDYERESHEFADISFKSALLMAKSIREANKSSKVSILYNEKILVELNKEEIAVKNKLKISLIPYSKHTQPIIQDGIVNVTDVNSGITSEFLWDYLILSPKRTVSDNDLKIGRILKLTHKKDGFLDTFNPKVEPGQQGGGGIYLSGSCQYPCSLEESLVSGHRLGRKLSSLILKSKQGKLFVPRIVCVVDEEKCVGCGLAIDICENSCFDVSDSGSVTKIDPMLCTGGGTCTAACPYNALTLQNSTTEQREARILSISKQIQPDGVIVIGCTWGGLASADNAGKEGLFYASRAYILGVPCVGQLDPRVLSRAFLDGASGIILVGCYPSHCHHSYGIDHAWTRVNLIKKLLRICEFDARRISLAHADFNKPEGFVNVVNSFNEIISKIGPIEKNKANLSKLKSMYALTANNTRVRHLLCTNLRSVKEETFSGNQDNSLNFDIEFSRELKNEFIQTSILNLLKLKNKPTGKELIRRELEFDQNDISRQLMDMLNRGIIEIHHVKNVAAYTCSTKR